QQRIRPVEDFTSTVCARIACRLLLDLGLEFKVLISLNLNSTAAGPMGHDVLCGFGTVFLRGGDNPSFAGIRTIGLRSATGSIGHPVRCGCPTSGVELPSSIVPDEARAVPQFHRTRGI